MSRHWRARYWPWRAETVIGQCVVELRVRFEEAEARLGVALAGSLEQIGRGGGHGEVWRFASDSSISSIFFQSDTERVKRS